MAAPPAQAHAMTVGSDTATVVGADDNDVSPHTGALPSTKGMRPCMHCQALQHPIRLKRHERSCLASQRGKHQWQHATSRCCFPDCDGSGNTLRYLQCHSGADRASTARLQHNEEDRNIATLQKTLHNPHERHARVNVGARPREVRNPTYKIPAVSHGSVTTCTTRLHHIAEEHNIVTLQNPLNTQYRQHTRVSVGARPREVRKPTHKIPPS